VPDELNFTLVPFCSCRFDVLMRLFQNFIFSFQVMSMAQVILLLDILPLRFFVMLKIYLSRLALMSWVQICMTQQKVLYMQNKSPGKMVGI